MKRIDLKETAEFLRDNDSFAILCHASPDGDTVGSAAALCLGLRSMGKKAYIKCGDSIPEKFAFACRGCTECDFTEKTVVAVDVADKKLLGRLEPEYGDKVELCIDHHLTNTEYADRLCLIDAAANCENIYALLKELGVKIDANIANALFLGVSTDTGCFKYANTTPETHIIAAELMAAGADAGEINRRMFDTKTRARTELERMVLDSMEFYFDGRCAVIALTNEMRKASGCTDGDLDGISALPRTIEGVLVGVTLRERSDGRYKISLRSHEPVNAAELCARLGGGGHARAAGCETDGPLENARAEILNIIKDVFE